MRLEFTTSLCRHQELWKHVTGSFLLQSFSRGCLQVDALFDDESLSLFGGLAVKLHLPLEAILEFDSHLIHQVLQVFLLAKVFEFIHDRQDKLVASC